MDEQKQILKNLADSVKLLGDMKKNLIQNLSNEQKIKINQFEVDYATLRKNGDVIGAQKLADKFKEENK